MAEVKWIKSDEYDCIDCEYYFDNKWKLVCLNKKNEEGIIAAEKGKDICEFFCRKINYWR